ncbi:MAG: hypothetical protein QOD38_63 [Acidimicrobiaceae bacterium]
MLVLLSFGLVLVATVLLVLGLLVGDGLTLIYVSIGLSAAAAVILFVAVRVSKPKTAPVGAPAPLVPEAEPQYATVGAPAAEATATVPTVPPPPMAEAPAAEGDEWLAADQEWEEPAAEWDEGDVEFPIADYDELTVDEILPLLPQLYTDELDIVENRERAGQNRAAIVDELQRLRDAAAGDGDSEYEAEEEAFFPIEDYDELSIREIVQLLPELDDEELAEVRAHEASNQKRRAILQDIDARTAPARRRTAPAKKKAPAKKAAAPARKKAAPAKKKAGPAKKAAAPTRKAPAKKAAPARKAPAKKAAAPARRAAAPAKKKAAPAKKKATPVKKAAAKKRR